MLQRITTPTQYSGAAERRTGAPRTAPSFEQLLSPGKPQVLFGSGVEPDMKLALESQGGQTLTDEQVKDLRERYDVENLSPQEKYNLMAELSGLGVISGADAVNSTLSMVAMPTVNGVPMMVKAGGGILSDSTNYLSTLQNTITQEQESYRFMEEVHGKRFDDVNAMAESHQRLYDVLATLNRSNESATDPAGVTPTVLYEQMTMKSAADTKRSGTVVAGVTWTDETLAVLAGAQHGVTIDTTNPVNWNATGEHTLTEEELGELRSKYNLEELSPQNYYDLMSDLTNLNAISAADIHGMHLKTIPPAGMYASSSSAFGGKSFTIGNIFDALGDELSSLSEMNDFLLDADFWKKNPNVDRERYDGYREYLQSRTDSMNRLKHIFEGIRG